MSADAETLPNYARVFNDQLDKLITMGVYPAKAERLAGEHADIVAQIGRCTPKPVDWDLP
jgi:hypothetical protein